jgi:hypothetical protein
MARVIFALYWIVLISIFIGTIVLLYLNEIYGFYIIFWPGLHPDHIDEWLQDWL